MTQVPKQIKIGVSADGKTLRIQEEPEEGYKLPKSGSITDHILIDAIKKRGICLPACLLLG